jgi:hypothetical protein
VRVGGVAGGEFDLVGGGGGVKSCQMSGGIRGRRDRRAFLPRTGSAPSSGADRL